ncbi:MAG: hypothetical protein WBQ34_12020 [Candidatus Acidiferrales bacterium]
MQLGQGFLDPVAVRVGFQNGNRANYECHDWYFYGDRLELMEAKNGRLLIMKVLTEVASVVEVDAAEEARVRRAQARV